MKELRKRFVLGVRLCDEKEIENSITFNEKLGRTTLVLDGRVIRANLQKGDVWNEKIGLLITLLNQGFDTYMELAQEQTKADKKSKKQKAFNRKRHYATKHR